MSDAYVLSSIPLEVTKIISKLEKCGFKAYLVGGSIRDLYSGITPTDWDITTNADIQTLKELYPSNRDIGVSNKNHDTVLVEEGGKHFEITKFRTASNDILDDLKHRDFTFNSIAYNPSVGILDPFHGYDDLLSNKIVFTDSTIDRIREDPLRILRALRFQAKYGFYINNSTLTTMDHYIYMLQDVAIERIKSELDKIFVSKFSKVVTESTIFNHIITTIMPEFKSNIEPEDDRLWITTIEIVNSCLPLLELKWAALFHNIATINLFNRDNDEEEYEEEYDGEWEIERSITLSKDIMERFRFDNKTIYEICQLIKYKDVLHDFIFSYDKSIKEIRKVLGRLGIDLTLKLLELYRAMFLNKNFKDGSFDNLLRIYKYIIDIKANNECLTLKDMNLNGDDMISLGYEGLQIGRGLNFLLDAIISDKVRNNKQELITYLNSYTEEWL